MKNFKRKLLSVLSVTLALSFFGIVGSKAISNSDSNNSAQYQEGNEPIGDVIYQGTLDMNITYSFTLQTGDMFVAGTSLYNDNATFAVVDQYGNIIHDVTEIDSMTQINAVSEQYEDEQGNNIQTGNLIVSGSYTDENSITSSRYIVMDNEYNVIYTSPLTNDNKEYNASVVVNNQAIVLAGTDNLITVVDKEGNVISEPIYPVASTTDYLMVADGHNVSNGFYLYTDQNTVVFVDNYGNFIEEYTLSSDYSRTIWAEAGLWSDKGLVTLTENSLGQTVYSRYENEYTGEITPIDTPFILPEPISGNWNDAEVIDGNIFIVGDDNSGLYISDDGYVIRDTYELSSITTDQDWNNIERYWSNDLFVSGGSNYLVVSGRYKDLSYNTVNDAVVYSQPSSSETIIQYSYVRGETSTTFDDVYYTVYDYSDNSRTDMIETSVVEEEAGYYYLTLDNLDPGVSYQVTFYVNDEATYWFNFISAGTNSMSNVEIVYQDPSTNSINVSYDYVEGEVNAGNDVYYYLTNTETNETIYEATDTVEDDSGTYYETIEDVDLNTEYELEFRVLGTYYDPSLTIYFTLESIDDAVINTSYTMLEETSAIITYDYVDNDNRVYDNVYYSVINTDTNYTEVYMQKTTPVETVTGSYFFEIDNLDPGTNYSVKFYINTTYISGQDVNFETPSTASQIDNVSYDYINLTDTSATIIYDYKKGTNPTTDNVQYELVNNDTSQVVYKTYTSSNELSTGEYSQRIYNLTPDTSYTVNFYINDIKQASSTTFTTEKQNYVSSEVLTDVEKVEEQSPTEETYLLTGTSSNVEIIEYSYDGLTWFEADWTKSSEATYNDTYSCYVTVMDMGYENDPEWRIDYSVQSYEPENIVNPTPEPTPEPIPDPVPAPESDSINMMLIVLAITLSLAIVIAIPLTIKFISNRKAKH